MTLPKISIVTPSYNQGQFLEETLRSVLDQNYPNLEYIVIDGGSMDQSVEIIKKYEKHLAYWVSERDRGQSDAINKGFARADGEIFGWINSDDYYYPGVFTKVADYFGRWPDIDFIFGYSDAVDLNGRITARGTYFPYVAHPASKGFAQIAQPASFWRRSTWKKYGPLDLSLEYLMDFDFFLKIIKHKVGVRGVPLRVCAFRYHSTSKTVAHDYESRIAYRKLLMKHDAMLRKKLFWWAATVEVWFFRLLKVSKRLICTELLACLRKNTCSE